MSSRAKTCWPSLTPPLHLSPRGITRLLVTHCADHLLVHTNSSAIYNPYVSVSILTASTHPSCTIISSLSAIQLPNLYSFIYSCLYIRYLFGYNYSFIYSCIISITPHSSITPHPSFHHLYILTVLPIIYMFLVSFFSHLVHTPITITYHKSITPHNSSFTPPSTN